MGRRRNRGRGRDARALDSDADSRGDRLSARRARCVPGATATDLVLTVTQMLRKRGVVNKFVEYLRRRHRGSLSVADRATLGNMSPEYGATIGFFPVDDQTLEYLRLTGRAEPQVRADRGLLQGAGAVSHRGFARADLHRHAGARSRRGRAEPRRTAPPAGSRAAAQRRRASSAASWPRRSANHEGVDPTADRATGSSEGGNAAVAPHQRSRPPTRSGPAGASGRGRRARAASFRARPRLGGDRRDHELHQHLESVGDDGRGTAREEGGRARAHASSRGSRPASRPDRKSSRTI